MKITGTFLDEISHDIPHQNWGYKEWHKDFAAMKAIGIDTVILIRCGYKRFMTFNSNVLTSKENCYAPPLDLLNMYLDLAEEFGMKFFFGTYDSGNYWHNNQHQKEIELNKMLIDEVWSKYGSKKAFGGWYLNQEVSRRYGNIIDIYAEMGKFCKEISNNLPVMISPYICGIKAIDSFSTTLCNQSSIELEEHEHEWNAIMSAIQDSVDIVAFQDGHCEYSDLEGYLRINQTLAKKYGMECWTNCETFDRDMPIKYLPIKWEKMLLKLEAAKRVGIEKAITFEFSHFMSPNSAYLQAGNLYNRYCEYFNIN